MANLLEIANFEEKNKKFTGKNRKFTSKILANLKEKIGNQRVRSWWLAIIRSQRSTNSK